MTQLDVAIAPAEPQVPVSEPEPATNRRPADWIALLVVVAAVFALAIWVLSPRFEIETPSLVDDWASLSRSADDVAQLLRLQNPESGRFAPSLAFWNYVQWHTFGAPDSLVGPNAWNLLRVFTLVAGLSLLTAVALPRARGGVWNAILTAALAGIPAFAVVTVPKFARDMARFVPQEPFLVGALALGGALLVLAARPLLAPRPVAGRVVALAILGTAVWVFGAYHKEASVCAVPLLAAVLFAGRGRLRDWRLLSGGRRTALGMLGAAVALPLVHVMLAGLRIAARGDVIYGAEVGGGDLWTGFVDLYDWAHEPLPENARLFMWSAIVLTVLSALVKRRIDVVAVGALASGVASLAFAGQSGVLATRYYIPAYALFAVAFALSLARLPTPVQLAGVLGVLLAFTPVTETRAEVQRWTDEELAGAAVVREAAALETAGCTLAIAGVDPETTLALPVVVRLEDGSAERSCDGEPAYFLLGPDGASTSLYSACAEGALGTMVEGPLVLLHRCARLREEPVRDPELGLVSPERLVALHRFDSSGPS